MLSLNCKHVQHVNIYLPCNFEVNMITDSGDIALFHQMFIKKKQYFSSYISKTIRDRC